MAMLVSILQAAGLICLEVLAISVVIVATATTAVGLGDASSVGPKVVSSKHPKPGL